jgi:hypothetical protein
VHNGLSWLGFPFNIQPLPTLFKREFQAAMRVVWFEGNRIKFLQEPDSQNG